MLYPGLGMAVTPRHTMVLHLVDSQLQVSNVHAGKTLITTTRSVPSQPCVSTDFPCGQKGRRRIHAALPYFKISTINLNHSFNVLIHYQTSFKYKTKLNNSYIYQIIKCCKFNYARYMLPYLLHQLNICLLTFEINLTKYR